MTESSGERRNHPRYSTSLELQGTPQDGGVVARMVADNLSVGGLYCTSTVDFPEMTRLAVRLMVPRKGETHPLDVEAVVVRRRPVPSSNGNPRYELALLFTNLDDIVRESISRLVRQN